eukprot:Hpha_TRINITY_DN10537_c0_g3::TRINITY_DN10537_c0_g3_i1::g.31412::m.31412
MASVEALRWIQQVSGTVIVDPPPLPEGLGHTEEECETSAGDASCEAGTSQSASWIRSGIRARVCSDPVWMKDCFTARGLPLDIEDPRLSRAGTVGEVGRIVLTAAGWKLVRARFEDGGEEWFPEDTLSQEERMPSDAEIFEYCVLEKDETHDRLTCEDTEAARRFDQLAPYAPCGAPLADRLEEVVKVMLRRLSRMTCDEDFVDIAETAVKAAAEAAEEQKAHILSDPETLPEVPEGLEDPCRARTVLRVGPVQPLAADAPEFQDLVDSFDDEVLPVVVHRVPCSRFASQGLASGMRILSVDGVR